MPREAAAGRAVRDDHREAVRGAALDVGERAAVRRGQRAFAHGRDHRDRPRARGRAVTSAGLVQPSSFRPSSSSSRSSSSTCADALLAAGREAAEDGPAGERRARAEGERLEHVGAAADAAVDQHLDPLADRLDHLGQGVQRRGDAVELAPAVVRDDHRGRAVLGGQQRVLGGQDPLDHERQRADRVQPLEVAPGERVVDDRVERRVEVLALQRLRAGSAAAGRPAARRRRARRARAGRRPAGRPSASAPRSRPRPRPSTSSCVKPRSRDQ